MASWARIASTFEYTNSHLLQLKTYRGLVLEWRGTVGVFAGVIPIVLFDTKAKLGSSVSSLRDEWNARRLRAIGGESSLAKGLYFLFLRITLVFIICIVDVVVRASGVLIY